jgi:TonB dependent receptor/TonB-dependent Receptor Plug Domain
MQLAATIRSDYKRALFLLLFCALPVMGQSRMGELRLKVTDSSGLGVKSSVALVSEANHFQQEMVTDDAGVLLAKYLPFGVYHVRVTREGFAASDQLIEIRTAVPAEFQITLSVATVNTSVVVNDSQTLIDPHRTGTVNQIGADTLEHKAISTPGRSVIDLVNSEPGWLVEANGVLHPRGSEYQTQYVVDGIPFTDNRSPTFAPEIDADEISSLTVLTANFPAEYGRKLGGVIEVNTAKDARDGLHGQAGASGGSFGTAGAFLETQYAWDHNAFGISAGGADTNRYLDPPVLENFTNSATTSDFAAYYDHDFSARDRLGFLVRHEQATFYVPNEHLQEMAGQLQDRASGETLGIISYQHIFSPNVLGDLHTMVRDLSATLASNGLATPITAGQDRGFREGYLKAALAVHQGRHEWKAGVEGDFGSVRENFQYKITDLTQFDPGTLPNFQFTGQRLDLEQAAFVQDYIRLGRWTVTAGVRWDHYQLIENQNAVSPRLGAAWYWPREEMVFHASYDRVFITPAFENLLLSSSPELKALSPEFLHLPVKPSLGNLYEAGLTKGFLGKLKLDANYFERDFSNYADDDLLLNTGVSFPIAFRKGKIYGAEAKIEVPHWGPFSGYFSYSYMVGFGYTPVTGGLLLGDGVKDATANTGRFPISQDQRNTGRARVRYQPHPRLWLAFGGDYGSGLPMEFSGTPQDVIKQYGQAILDRLNLARGRVLPSLALDASAGAILWRRDNLAVRFQADLQNLNNRLNVINFAGLFSGTAIAPPRSYALRLQTDF